VGLSLCLCLSGCNVFLHFTNVRSDPRRLVCVCACVQCPVLAAAQITWFVARKVARRGLAIIVWPVIDSRLDLRSGDTNVYTLFCGYCVHVAVLLHSTVLSLFGNFLSASPGRFQTAFVST